MNTTEKSLTNQQRVLLFLFFISGFAALLYQVVWQRWLVFYTGIGIVSISLIVSAFMVGLGIGYVVGGTIADRSKKSKTILYFVIAEIGIGTFALLSKSIFYDFLYNSELLSFGNSFLKTYIVLFLSLVFPTFLMGLSLPLLSKAFELRSVHDQTDFLNYLYFVNTFGAATGAFVSGVLLMQLFGMQVTVYFGAMLNYTCAMVSFVIYRKETRRSPLNTIESNNKIFTNIVWTKDFIFWILQYFISGFAALSLELLWFRILDNSIKSLSITFSILLSIYLLSMALGTFFGVKVSRIEKVNKTKIFLLAQYILYFTAIFSIVVLLYSIKSVNLLSFLSNYFRSYDLKLELSSLPIIVIVYFVLPVFLMSIPTFLMGLSFAISQKIVQDSFSEVGRKVGVLQAVNIAGSTLGTWFVTFIGFKYLGSSLTLQLTCCLCVIYLSILLYKKFITLKFYIPGFLLTTIIIIIFPPNNTFWNILGESITLVK